MSKRVNDLAMWSVTMRLSPSLLIRPEMILRHYIHLMRWMMRHGLSRLTAKLRSIGMPSWCSHAAMCAQCKSQSTGVNINTPLSMARLIMNYSRYPNGGIAPVRHSACVILARWLAILVSMMTRCWSIISARAVCHAAGSGHAPNKFW